MDMTRLQSVEKTVLYTVKPLSYIVYHILYTIIAYSPTMDCEAQLGKLIAAIGKDSVSMVVEALPKTILTMTACTGSGTLEIVLEVVVKELNQQFGCELEVRVGNTFRVF